MGVMRFLLHPQEILADWPDWSTAYITGLDGRVFPTRTDMRESVLTCTRQTSDSGKLHVAWPVAGHGRPVLTTTSLREAEVAYLLPLELARGKVGELREQLFQWEFAGMTVPEDLREQMRLAFLSFSKASALRAQPERAGVFAQECLKHSCTAAELLGRTYTQQRENSRRQAFSHPPALLGCELDESVCDATPLHEDFFGTFTATSIQAQWSRIEPVEGAYAWEPIDAMVACSQRERRIIRGGPLIDFSVGGLPAWLAPWTADFDNLQSFVCDFVETAVNRYAGSIRVWEVSARANTGGGLPLSEEQRLALAARTLEAAQRSDADAQYFIRINRPWGEYQSAGGYRISPFQFVDALVRSRIGLTGVNLEVAVGCGPEGDRHRDLLGFSKLIDLWSMLGVQLHVTLAFPSSGGADPLAGVATQAQVPQWRGEWDEASQAEWARDYVSLLLAKPNVTGVFWSHFNDGLAHRFPHAGVVRADGTAKPLLQVFQQLRRPEPAPVGSDSARLDGDGTWVEQ
jgi:hypothetical protein